MCTTYLTNFQPGAIAYKPSGKPPQTDDELALLKHTIMTSWPANIREIPQILHPYWAFREELTIEEGLFLKALASSYQQPNEKQF